MKKSSVSKSSAVKSSVRSSSLSQRSVGSSVIRADISEIKVDRYGVNFGVASGVMRLTNSQIADLFQASRQK